MFQRNLLPPSSGWAWIGYDCDTLYRKVTRNVHRWWQADATLTRAVVTVSTKGPYCCRSPWHHTWTSLACSLITFIFYRIPRTEDEGSMFVRNVGARRQSYMTLQRQTNFSVHINIKTFNLNPMKGTINIYLIKGASTSQRTESGSLRRISWCCIKKQQPKWNIVGSTRSTLILSQYVGKSAKGRQNSPCNRPWRPRGWVEVLLYSFFNIGTSGCSIPGPGRFTTGKETRYPFYRRLGGSQSRSGRLRKVSPPNRIRSPDSPARSDSLHRLRYTGPCIVKPGGTCTNH
jgi:hypothetical protein